MISESNKNQPVVKITIGVLVAAFAILLIHGVYEKLSNDRSADNVYGFVIAQLFFIAVCLFVAFVMIASAFSRSLSHKFFSDAEIKDEECRKCLYDLSGSVLGGQTRCPECGSVIPDSQIQQLSDQHKTAK